MAQQETGFISGQAVIIYNGFSSGVHEQYSGHSSQNLEESGMCIFSPQETSSKGSHDFFPILVYILKLIILRPSACFGLFN